MWTAWLNLLSLHISALLFTYFGILSIMPAIRAETRGEKAWAECCQFRNISGLFWLVMFANTILWVWFPVPELAWSVFPDFIMSIFTGIVIAIPCAVLMMKGMKDAGKETWIPSEKTKMFGGIYNHIRHPQTLAEMSLWIVIALFINSLFLVLWMVLFVILVIPMMIHYEERDLVKRFGDEYIEYQRRTGALIPKFWKRG